MRLSDCLSFPFMNTRCRRFKNGLTHFCFPLRQNIFDLFNKCLFAKLYELLGLHMYLKISSNLRRAAV